MRSGGKKAQKKKQITDQVNWPLGGQFHPIHEIAERDFLDGALVGAGSLKPQKTYISIQKGLKFRKPSILVVHWVSSCLSFFLSASTAATYIFTALTCTISIISLEPCALNGEFQHFILRSSQMSSLCRLSLKQGIGGERRPKDRVKTGLLYG